jgi:hypothetical protein
MEDNIEIGSGEENEIDTESIIVQTKTEFPTAKDTFEVMIEDESLEVNNIEPVTNFDPSNSEEKTVLQESFSSVSDIVTGQVLTNNQIKSTNNYTNNDNTANTVSVSKYAAEIIERLENEKNVTKVRNEPRKLDVAESLADTT